VFATIWQGWVYGFFSWKNTPSTFPIYIQDMDWALNIKFLDLETGSLQLGQEKMF